MITYEEFVKDLKQNVSFKNPELIDENFDKLINPTCSMFVDINLSTQIYSLNKARPSDYFEYNGQQFCFFGNQIKCYSKHPLLLGIYGGDYSTIQNIKEKVKQALRFYKQMSARAKSVSYLGLDFNHDHLINELVSSIHIDLRDLFLKSTKHLLDFKLDKNKINKYKVSHIRSTYNSDYSYDFFKSVFDIDKAYEHMFENFNHQQLNFLYHKDHAIEVANGFVGAGKNKYGLSFKSDWRDSYTVATYLGRHYGIDHCFIDGAIKAFGYTGNQRCLDSIKAIMDSKLEPGGKLSIGGVICKVYKQHYTMTFSHNDVKDLLLYTNKFAPDTLNFQLGRNNALLCNS